MELLIGKTQDSEIRYQHPLVLNNITTKGLAGSTYQVQLAIQAIQAGAGVAYIECSPSSTPFHLFNAAQEAQRPVDNEIMQELGHFYNDMGKLLAGAVRWFGPSRSATEQQTKTHLGCLINALNAAIGRVDQLETPLVIFLNNVGDMLGGLPQQLHELMAVAKSKNISFVVSEHTIDIADNYVMEIADCKIYQYASTKTVLDFFHDEGSKVAASMDIYKPEAMLCLGRANSDSPESLMFEEVCLNIGKPAKAAVGQSKQAAA